MLSASFPITIQKDSEVSVRDQIVEQIGVMVASGVLAGGQKLPSIRALAQRLDIHHGVINSAYNQLATIGLLEIRQGSGVKVVPKAATAHEKGQESLDALFKYFLAQAADLGHNRTEIESCINRHLHRKPVKRILAVDNQPDFHPVLLAELKPSFQLPVEIITHEDLKKKIALIEDSLIITSLYHLLTLKDLPLDPTRFIVCNIETGEQEMNLMRSLPKHSVVLVVSESATLLNAGERLAAAQRQDISIKTVPLSDAKEIAYQLRFANLIICDYPSRETITKLAGKTPVRVFQTYSMDTINMIKERLKEWG